MIRTVEFTGTKIILIDQNALPHEFRTLEIRRWQEAAEAIRIMKVRGAPAIGVTASLGVVLAAITSGATSADQLISEVEEAADGIKATRPTAVNLFWAVDRVLALAHSLENADVQTITAELSNLGTRMVSEDEDACKTLGAYGAQLIPDGAAVLTHCNAGALACVSYGTALGVIRAAVESGKNIKVYADETRPRLQGMRLTAWELAENGIDVTVIADNMAASLMRQKKIDCVVVGADRIAANGDTANKIGTYSAAVAAKAHGVPFYVAAPLSTVDISLPNGDAIPIEERSEEEMTHIDGHRVAPAKVKVINPSFDVTPADHITAIITDAGVILPPFAAALRDALVSSDTPGGRK